MDKKITVTSPLLPDLGEFTQLLQQIWESKWLTNNGEFHKRLERELADYLGVPYISLFSNGTLPLITALQALKISGEVITTPYSFVATSHSIWWNGAVPVFVDVDPLTGNMDPDRIEEAITERTTAIMPVHVYGTPCESKRIDEIARKHGLKVIYDAAHAFGVQRDGRSVLLDGDMSTLSFHATKVYNTLEGGALIVRDAQTKAYVDQLKNFGFTGETTVEAPGINSKVDEVRAAYGLVNLKKVDAAIENRKRVDTIYREALAGVPGVRTLDVLPGVKHNYSYFPIFIDPQVFGTSRDDLYEAMKTKGVMGRRYFYPLISDFAPYSSLPSASRDNLPNAARLSDSVICLPMHHDLSERDIERVLSFFPKK